MRNKRFLVFVSLVLILAASSLALSAGHERQRGAAIFGSGPDVTSTSDVLLNPQFPDAYKLPQQPYSFPVSDQGKSPDGLTHPCGGMFAEPPFEGLSPLAIAYVPGMCNSGSGDISVW